MKINTYNRNMKINLLGLAVLLFVGNAFGQVYFEDNFNGSNLTTNNNWNIFNSTSNSFNHEWFHDVFNNNGRARVSNYDNTSSTNEELESWLISPAIDLSGSTSPVLTFDNTKRFTGDDIELLISTDYDGSSDPTDGFTWVDYTAAANFNDNIGSWIMTASDVVDLSTYNGQTIFVAFKYYGSNTDGSTYQIDNILLEEEGTSGGCANGIFCEDFEGGSLTANNAWTVQNVIPSGSGLTWGINTFNNESRAQISNYASGNNQELASWLITPAIDLTSYSDVVLSFDNTKRFAGDDLELLISIDYDGSSDPSIGFNWTNLSSVANLNDNIESWNMTNTGNISLNAFTGESSVYIAFKYYGGTSDGSTYRIDNILVQEFTVPPITTIYDIQFTTASNGASPLEGEVVTTTGIVTAVGNGFYFIQDGTGAWNGIEVFSNNNVPEVGDSVVLTGTVEEFFGMTQIAGISSFDIISNGNDLPAAEMIDLSDIGESYESVLISVEQVVCTNQNAGFNMWEVNDGTATMRVDDKFFVYTANQGSFYTVKGIINYAFNNFRISPRIQLDIEMLGNTVAYTSNDKVAAYPNPASDVLHITFENTNELSISIYDVMGKIVHGEVVAGSHYTFPVKNLKPGLYIARVNGESIRFVKE
jgi:hypothetical protein